MRASDRLGLAVMAAMMLALTCLQVISADSRLFWDCLLMISVVGIAGIVSRRLLPTDRAARLIQGVVTFVALVLVLMSEGISNPFALPAKDRSGRLDVTEPPDLGALLSKINATQKG